MDIVDKAGVRGSLASVSLDRSNRSILGQFLTPTPIAQFMASLFSDALGSVRLLDPGAGVGTLTAAFVDRLCAQRKRPDSVTLVSYEIAPEVVGPLRETLSEAQERLLDDDIAVQISVFADDFITSHSNGIQGEMFSQNSIEERGFTHVIMNPPYRKIRSESEHRAALRGAGVETSNLYAGFMYIAAQLLEDGGEMVAIVPRSFCNGPYFKPFRRKFFSLMGLKQIHVFERRDLAFGGDGVLQENVILHAIKDYKPRTVKVTVSRGNRSEVRYLSERNAEYASIIHPNDPECFVNVIASESDQEIAEGMLRLPCTLADLGLEVSTGTVVDFRSKSLLLDVPDEQSAPLLYPAHFRNNVLEWPKEMKKPNAVRITERSRKWLWPNQGCFVVTKRFSAKEERRRIVASVYSGDLPGDLIGFENHLNVFHVGKRGFDQPLATGLSLYLNSAFVESYFRQFNGHTQVNATDLRALRFPERSKLEGIGRKYQDEELSQHRIDAIINSELRL